MSDNQENNLEDDNTVDNQEFYIHVEGTDTNPEGTLTTSEYIYNSQGVSERSSSFYKIINDEDKLKEFIEWLPRLEPNEEFYISLYARNKYCKDVKHISSDKAQVARFLTNKDRMLDNIRQLEVPIGCYNQYRNGIRVEIPQEALALYVVPNPVSHKKATFKLINKLMKLIENDSHGYNLVQEALSSLHQTPSRRLLLDFDFDMDTKPDIIGIINPEACKWLKSRGGFHLIVETAKVSDEYVRTFYRDIMKLGADTSTQKITHNAEDDDQNYVIGLPIVGCTQGMFTPYFI